MMLGKRGAMARPMHRLPPPTHMWVSRRGGDGCSSSEEGEMKVTNGLLKPIDVRFYYTNEGGWFSRTKPEDVVSEWNAAPEPLILNKRLVLRVEPGETRILKRPPRRSGYRRDALVSTDVENGYEPLRLPTTNARGLDYNYGGEQVTRLTPQQRQGICTERRRLYHIPCRYTKKGPYYDSDILVSNADMPICEPEDIVTNRADPTGPKPPPPPAQPGTSKPGFFNRLFR